MHCHMLQLFGLDTRVIDLFLGLAAYCSKGLGLLAGKKLLLGLQMPALL